MLKKMNGEPIRRKTPDVVFKTFSGKTVKLTFEKNEYKTYMETDGVWRAMWLGSVVPEPLKEYIERRY